MRTENDRDFCVFGNNTEFQANHCIFLHRTYVRKLIPNFRKTDCFNGLLISELIITVPDVTYDVQWYTSEVEC